jgi:hypothetical protein
MTKQLTPFTSTAVLRAAVGFPLLVYGSLRDTDRSPRYAGRATIHPLSHAVDRQTGSGHRRPRLAKVGARLIIQRASEDA